MVNKIYQKRVDMNNAFETPTKGSSTAVWLKYFKTRLGQALWLYRWCPEGLDNFAGGTMKEQYLGDIRYYSKCVAFKRHMMRVEAALN
ncbi:MAG: hypothetical protein QGI09_08670 [Dehalococcoidia bacterium]|nr:hypothetical protein [Dehalococcoidia bacterium]